MKHLRDNQGMRSGRKEIWFLLGILALGVFARGWVYTQRESFWKDETGLARNFLVRDLSNIDHPFDNCQASPIGFCQISKLVEMAWGHTEKNFWLLPLLLGCGMLFLAAWVWRGQLPTGAWLLGIGALAFNTTLIDHTTQFKPYLNDAFWALAMSAAFFGLYCRDASSQKEAPPVLGDTGKETFAKTNLPWKIYLAVGLLSLWMSYTSVFVLAGLGLWQMGESLVRKDRAAFIRGIVVNLFLGGVFLFLWASNYSHIDSSGGFRSFWRGSFAPFIFNPGWAEWYSNNLGSVLGYLFGATQWAAMAFFVALGVAAAWGVNRKLLALWMPIGMCLIASWMGAYPIYDRLVMFVVGLIVPFLALGVWNAWEVLGKQHRGMIWVFLLFVVAPFLHPLLALPVIQDSQQLKQAALLTVAKARSGDLIYVHPRAVELYKYYFKRYTPQKGVEVMPGLPEDAKNFRGMLSRACSGRHLFFIYAEPMYQPNEILDLAIDVQNSGELVGIAEMNLAGVMELRVK